MATTRGDWNEWTETNRAMWDERVPIHAASEFYDQEAFRAGRDEIRAFEAAEVGDVTGKRLVHLQCHMVHNRSFERMHTLGDIITALCAAGLRLEFLHEHDFTLFQRFGELQRGEDGRFRTPDGVPRLPLMFSLKASRPS